MTASRFRSALPDDARALLLQLLRVGNTIQCACQVAGVPYSSFKLWLARGYRDRRANKTSPYAVFVAEVKKASAMAEAGHVANIAAAAKAGQWTASAWWLERRRHGRYGRKDRVELANDSKRPMIFTMHLPKLPAEQPNGNTHPFSEE